MQTRPGEGTGSLRGNCDADANIFINAANTDVDGAQRLLLHTFASRAISNSEQLKLLPMIRQRFLPFFLSSSKTTWIASTDSFPVKLLRLIAYNIINVNGTLVFWLRLHTVQHITFNIVSFYLHIINNYWSSTGLLCFLL